VVSSNQLDRSVKIAERLVSKAFNTDELRRLFDHQWFRYAVSDLKTEDDAEKLIRKGIEFLTALDM
jgi:hypothetical protein